MRYSIGKRIFCKLRRKRESNSLLFFALLIIFIYFLFVVFGRLNNIVSQHAAYKAHTLALEFISDAVSSELSNDSAYSRLISFEKASDGKITALLVDSQKINLLKENITRAILKKLADVPPADISVKLGDLTGNEIFLGKGPTVPVKISSVGKIDVKFADSFSSAGINHTRHKLIIEAELSFALTLPTSAPTVTAKSSIIVGETILVGDIPDSYTYIDDTRNDTLSKILDNK